ncbi:hypothetical protein SAMN04489761_4324 [Tenacibaculum sp. MAR_2009_124]|nr:hypothetical protein SAMN04489761_4324 [Tenacibaculum sp. MAR_2009_124]
MTPSINSKVIWKGLNATLKNINLAGKCTIQLSDKSLLKEIDITELKVK